MGFINRFVAFWVDFIVGDDWTVAVGARESTAVHGDAKFLHPFDTERPPWRLRIEDVRLAPDSPALSAGPDLDRIPTAPGE